MTLIEDVVRKMFGYKQEDFDPNSKEFAKRCIENAPNIPELNLDRDPNDVIKDYLFEQTDIAKQLKQFLDWKHDHDSEES